MSEVLIRDLEGSGFVLMYVCYSSSSTTSRYYVFRRIMHDYYVR